MAPDQVISQFLDRLQPQLAASFTGEQLAAVKLHFGMRYQVKHGIDWRRQIRLPLLKLYVIVLAGRDRPRAER